MRTFTEVETFGDALRRIGLAHRVKDEYNVVNDPDALIEKGSLRFCSATGDGGDRPGRLFVVAGGDVLLVAGAASKSYGRPNEYFHVQMSYAVVIDNGYLRTSKLA